MVGVKCAGYAVWCDVEAESSLVNVSRDGGFEDSGGKGVFPNLETKLSGELGEAGESRCWSREGVHYCLKTKTKMWL